MYTCGEVKAAGYVEGLKAAGYSCAEAKAAGYSCMEAKAAGYTPQECGLAGYPHQDGVAAGYRYNAHEWAIGMADRPGRNYYTWRE